MKFPPQSIKPLLTRLYSGLVIMIWSLIGHWSLVIGHFISVQLKRLDKHDLLKVSVSAFLAFILTFSPVLPSFKLEHFKLLGALTSEASYITWTNAAGNHRWSDPANWSEGIVPGANDIATFNGTSIADVRVENDISIAGLYIDKDYDGTVTFSSTQRVTIGTDGITQKGGTFDGGQTPMIVYGSVKVMAGDFTAPRQDLEIKQHLAVFTDRFNANTGTIYFTGGDQVITGSFTLNNFVKQVDTYRSLQFQSGNLISVQGMLTLTGTATAPLDLRASDPGQPASINIQDAYEVSYVDVQDMINIGSTVSCPDTCFDSGNNTGWTLPAIKNAVTNPAASQTPAILGKIQKLLDTDNNQSSQTSDGTITLQDNPASPPDPPAVTNPTAINATPPTHPASYSSKPTVDFSSDENVAFKINIRPATKQIILDPVTAQNDNYPVITTETNHPDSERPDANDALPSSLTPKNSQPLSSASKSSLIHYLTETGSRIINFLGLPVAHAALDNEDAQPADPNQVRARILDPAKQEIDQVPVITDINGETIITLPEPGNAIRPGKYQLEVTVNINGEDVTITQDFTWGVLAMNLDQSTYEPGQEVSIGFGVLDDGGRTICDADLTLDITGRDMDGSDLDNLQLTTEDGINRSPDCGPTTITNAPDYSAIFTPEQIGEYTLYLTAQTINGTRRMTRTFLVTDEEPYVTKRSSATRIFPLADYASSVTITATEDFQGDVYEMVPDSFKIKGITSSGTVIFTDPGQKPYATAGVGGPNPVETPVNTSDAPAAGNTPGVDGETPGVEEAVTPTAPAAPVANTPGAAAESASPGVEVGKSPAIEEAVTSTGKTPGVDGETPGVEEVLHPVLNPVHPDTYQQPSDQDQYIVWQNVSIKAGKSVTLTYVYDAPDKSPEFYLLGPLTLSPEDKAPNPQQIQYNNDPNSATTVVSDLEISDLDFVSNLQSSDLGFPVWSEPHAWQIAADAIFTSAASGYWNIGTTWGGACASSCVAGTDFPGASDIAIVTGKTVTLNAAASATNLTIVSAGKVNIAGNNLTVSGDFTIDQEGTLIAQGSETISTIDTNSGTVMYNGTATYNGLAAGDAYNDLIINNGLVGYWKFDDGVGTTVWSDSSGYGNHGTGIGATGTNNTPQADANNAVSLNFSNPYSLDFDGTDDYVDVGNISQSNVKTISFWINASDTTTRELINFDDTDEIELNGSSVITAESFPGTTTIYVNGAVASTVTANTWQHVAITNTTGVNASNLDVGKTDGTNYFDGLLDEVRIYNHALTEQEINSLAAGSISPTGTGKQLLDANLDVDGDLILNSGELDISSSNYTINVAGSWENNGALFTPQSGTVALDGYVGASHELQSGGQAFNNLSMDVGGFGAPDSWTLHDDLDVDGTFLQTTGTLDTNATNNWNVHANDFDQTSGDFISNTSTLTIDSATNQTIEAASSLYNLAIEDPTETNLVGYWKFDEGQGTTAADSSGNANHGTLTNSPKWTTTVTSTISYDNPYSLDFDGTNDYVNAGDINAVDSATELTVSSWIKVDSLTKDSDIIAKGNHSASGPMLFWRDDSVGGGSQSGNTDALSVLITDSGSDTAWTSTPTGSLNDSGWHHALFTYTANTAGGLKIYIDGVNANNATTVGVDAVSPTSNKITIGAPTNVGTANAFDGKIDDVRIYTAALTAPEIANLADGYYANGDSGTATFTLNANLDVNGSVYLQSGILDVSATPYNITLAKDWNNYGGTSSFTDQTGTVTLDGTSQTIRGSTTFYNLTDQETTSDTLTFQTGTTQTIANTLDFDGIADNLLSLRSSVPSTRYTLDVTSPQTLTYLDVQDSNASTSDITCSTGCTNSGNNDNAEDTPHWVFTVAFSISGIVYSDEGSTPLGNQTVRLAENGTDNSTTAESNASTGAYSITVTAPAAGTVLTLYLEDETADAVTVTVTNGTAHSDVDLYQNYLITRHDNGGALTNANLLTAAVSAEDDISNIYSVSGSDLTTAANKNLYIAASSTFAPGGAISLGGSFNNQGTFTHGSSTVTFTGDGDAGADTYTVNSGASSFNHLTMNLTDDADTLQTTDTDTLDVAGNLTLTNGIFDNATYDEDINVTGNVDMNNDQTDMGDGTWTVAGNWDHRNMGTLNYNASTLVLTGSSKTHTFDSAKPLYNVTVNSGASYSGVWGMIYYGNFTVESDASITFNSNSLLALGDSLVVDGTLDGTATNSKIGKASGSTTISGTGTVALPLRFSPNHDNFITTIVMGASVPTFTGTIKLGNYYWSKTVTLDNSTNNPNLVFQGDLIVDPENKGVTWTKGTGNITFSGTSDQSINFLDKSVEDVVINKSSGTVTLTDGVTTESLTVTDGTLDLNGQAFTVSGTVSNDDTIIADGSETVSWTNDTNSGTVMYNGTGDYNGLAAGDAYNDLIINNGLVGYWKFDEGSGTSVTDSSGYGNNGTWSGSAGGSNTSPNWVSGTPYLQYTNPYSMDFDGTDDYVNLGNTFKFTSSFSVSTWIKLDALSGQPHIINKMGSSPNRDWRLAVDDSPSLKSVFSVSTSGSNIIERNSATSVSVGEWVHIAGVYDSNAVSLDVYMNGVLDNGTLTGTIPASIYTTNNPVWIGNRPLSGFPFDGLIDDVRIYDHALTEQEVNTLAAGSISPTGTGKQILDANLDVNGDLILNSGELDVSSSNYTINVAGTWENNGALFTPRSSTVTLDGNSGSHELQSGGQSFNNLTINYIGVGKGGTWTLQDDLDVDGTLTQSKSTLNTNATYSWNIHANDFDQTGGVFTPNTSTLTIDSATNQTIEAKNSLYNLAIEDPTESNLVGYWKFDEGQGTTAADSSGNANHGTLTNAPKWTTTVTSTITYDNPYSLDFDGVNDYVHIKDTTSFNVASGGGLTATAWVKTDDTEGPVLSLRSSTSGNPIVELPIGYNGATTNAGHVLPLVRYDNNTGLVQVTSSKSVSDNIWHFVAVELDQSGNTLKAYIDDSSYSVAQNTDGAITTTLHQSIGTELRWVADAYGTADQQYLDGQIDDVRIYNTALGASAIQSLADGYYANGDSGTATFTLNANLDINGSVYLQSGILDVSATPYDITLAKDWNNYGGTSSFTDQTGDVTLDGTNQTIRGSTTFYDLTDQETSSDTLTFQTGTTQTIANTLDFDGIADNLLSLRSSVPSTRFTLDVTSPQTLTYIDVQDSNASTSDITCTTATCVNSGNNDDTDDSPHWIFTEVATRGRVMIISLLNNLPHLYTPGV